MYRQSPNSVNFEQTESSLLENTHYLGTREFEGICSNLPNHDKFSLKIPLYWEIWTTWCSFETALKWGPQAVLSK